ncbi:Uu.00g051040.m01.CDS01 [Anthostomella pinea]|uniref:Uu.00g051040.m01.CDS01 n=1 Tax=Anthostomella pinea TaxID=933095 RepID=A0AAI8VSS5_9PEZI|nr:Uu.00g051040.m01.CDS01 [Anthostomella pinea]
MSGQIGLRNNHAPLIDANSLPTVAQLSVYLQSLFPQRDGDTRFDYHVPRPIRSTPHTSPASHAVLSITPTPGFYAALAASPSPTPLGFLQRPWRLDGRRVPRLATVLSCHKGFDEVLTVGNNAALASVLGMDLARSAVIQGYKGDPDGRFASELIPNLSLLHMPVPIEAIAAVEVRYGGAENEPEEGEEAQEDEEEA